MPLELLLSLRFLMGSSSEKNISSMIKVCFISIFTAIFSLTLILAITRGFEKTTEQKLQSIHSDVIMQTQGKPLNFAKIRSVIKNEFSQDISELSPIKTSQIIISDGNQQESNTNNLVIIKAVDSKLEPKVNAFKDMLINTQDNSHDWSFLLSKNKIFIGQNLATNLNLELGQNIKLYYPEDNSVKSNKISFDEKDAIISGIFKTGINEFDEHVIISSIDFFDTIFNIGVNQINIKLFNPANEKQIINKLKSRFNLNVNSWKELYPAIVSALDLEKKAMLLILFLVALVASMNLISLIYMFIIQKREQIAILKSMGLTNSKIIYIFILLSLIITVSASISGSMLASIISWIIDYFKLIHLPDAYYVDYLPADINFISVLLINIGVIILTILVSIIPTSKIKDINVAQILKSKGI